MTNDAGRPLTELERSVALAMIDHATDDRVTPSPEDRCRWRELIGRATVCGHCDCGLCPSVDLAIDGVPVESCNGRRLVLEASADNRGVILFIDDDKPSYLEVYGFDDDPVDMPRPEELIFR